MYCTCQDVRDASELLEDANVIADDSITPVILKAQGRIDSALKARYTVPLVEPVPEIIKSIAQDMAAGMLISKTFSNQLGQDQINLSNQYLKRADNDLALVIKEQQLDGMPGIKLASQPGADTTPAMSSTTPHRSPIEGIIKEW